MGREVLAWTKERNLVRDLREVWRRVKGVEEVGEGLVDWDILM